MAQRLQLPTRIAVNGTRLALRAPGLQAEGAPFDDEMYRRVMSAVKNGDPVSLELDAITYIQRATPNRNAVRFRDKRLKKLAKSYAGVPFQRNHSTKVEDRGGTVIASKLVQVRDKSDGTVVVVPGEALANSGDNVGTWPAFSQRLSLVKGWAIEGALDGTLDRFSIAWNPTGPVSCSICGEEMLDAAGWYTGKCSHFPGAAYELKGKPTICELVYEDAEGTELSGVSVPAVVGTRIEDIEEPDPVLEVQKFRAALSLARQGGQEPPKEPPVMAYTPQLVRLAYILGISIPSSGEVDLDEVVKQVENTKTELAASKAQLAEMTTARDKLATALDAADAVRVTIEVDGLLADAVRGGKLVQKRDSDGKVVEGEIEAWIRQLAKTGGLAAAKDWITRAPKIGPSAPAARAARNVDPTKRLGGAEPQPGENEQPAPGFINAGMASKLKAMGVDPKLAAEIGAKYGYGVYTEDQEGAE